MEGINEDLNVELQVISKKSWTAYVGPLLILLVLFFISISFHFLLGVIPAALAVLAILNIRSVELYINDDGVWIYSGIFPWNKGSTGVK